MSEFYGLDVVRWATPEEAASKWPEGVPEGTRAAWRIDEKWSIPTEAQRIRYKQCRHSLRTKCPNPVAAICWRAAHGRRRRDPVQQPWAYCKEHMFGRLIEDGRVIALHLVETGDGSDS